MPYQTHDARPNPVPTPIHRPLHREQTTVLSTLWPGSPSPCILTRPKLCAGTGLLGLNSRAAPKACHHAPSRHSGFGGALGYWLLTVHAPT